MRAVLFLWICILSVESAAQPLLKESFDTFLNPAAARFDARMPDYRIVNGNLVLQYSSITASPPCGIECTLPISSKGPVERQIEMNFGGGGMESSNSFFICYAMAPGAGLSLPPFSYGPASNIRTGRRTGYIIRFLRHGDGANEVVFYRNDSGWIVRLRSETLDFNPVTALRRVVIRHRSSGEHLVAATFDTGAFLERTYHFEDDRYLPDREHRGIQLIAKSHTRTEASLRFYLDTWVVDERPMPGKSIKKKKDAGKEPPPKSNVADTSQIFAAEKLYEQGNYVAAHASCLEVFERDPANDDALDLLGRIESAVENYSDAYKHLSGGLDIRKSRYGSESLKVTDSLEHLAIIHSSLDPSTAESFYNQALSIKRKILGPEHPDVAGIMDRLAGFYLGQDRPADAEELWKTSLIIRLKVLGPNHKDVAENLSHLARLYFDQRQYDNAISHFSRALAIQEKIFGPMHPEVESILHFLEQCYKTTGRLQDAETTFKRSLAIIEKNNGPDHPDAARCLNYLANIYVRERRNAEAVSALKRGISILEKAKGPNHIELAAMLNDLAVVYDGMRKLNEIEPLLKRSLSIYEKNFGPEHDEISKSLNNLASLNCRLGRYGTAEPLFKRALSIREKKFGSNDPDLYPLLVNMAQMYRLMDRSMEADYYEHRADILRQK